MGWLLLWWFIGWGCRLEYQESEFESRWIKNKVSSFLIKQSPTKVVHHLSLIGFMTSSPQRDTLILTFFQKLFFPTSLCSLKSINWLTFTFNRLIKRSGNERTNEGTQRRGGFRLGFQTIQTLLIFVIWEKEKKKQKLTKKTVATAEASRGKVTRVRTSAGC